MTELLADLADQLLRAARLAGAEAADALVIRDSAQMIDVRGGVLEQAERSEATELGLRVLIGQRQANVSASDLRPETIAIMAERAVAMAREAPEDAHIGLAAAGQLAGDCDSAALELCDPTPEPSPDALLRDAAEAESAALDTGLLSQVQSASASYGATQVHLAASNGFSAGYARTSRSVSCVAIAGEGAGMERDYDSDSRIFQSDLRPAAGIGICAARRAAERVGARKPATGRFPVLFDERVAGSLIAHLLSACNGAAVARGASWLADGLGTQVLPETMTLRENPHRARVSGSRQFDAEGLATTPRDIVAGGILTGWTLDLASARQLGHAPTGNAARGTSGPPRPVNWNVTLSQGTHGRDALLRDMGTGLLVTSMIGATINPNTGDYSRGAAGFWVEGGEIAYPVNECTIAGNLRDMLRRLVPGNDARMHLSRAVPSLLVEGLTLAGT